MHPKTLQSFDEIDAAVFSGDLLYTDSEMFRDHLRRWIRAHNVHRTFTDGVEPPTVDWLRTEALTDALGALMVTWTETQMATFKLAFSRWPVLDATQLADAYNLARRTAIARISRDREGTRDPK